MSNCHICDGQLDDFEQYPDLYQITSDCRPWRKGNRLCICQECATVQKPVTKKWLDDIKEIYTGYEMYSQGGGIEQSTFDANSGNSTGRTEKIVDWLNKINLPRKGKLLEIGCGNGAFLRSFSSRYPYWELSGLEITNKNKAVVESIPGVSKLHVERIENLKERFDIIVLIYVLEHIPNPVKFLRLCLKALNPEGKIILQVPNLKDSHFDILIADHCIHFSMATLETVVKISGLEINGTSADLLPKELTLLAQKIDNSSTNRKNLENIPNRAGFDNEKTIVKMSIEWLIDLIKQGQSAQDNIGIFGTSISATWLATYLGNKVKFFVDEDINRIGRTHMGKPIYDFANTPNSNPILMPLIPTIAGNIKSRHKCKNLILPPKYGTGK